MRQQGRGFTLIELMITVVVVGILAAIAIPSYRDYVRRTACEDAKGALTGLANAMERYRAQQGDYLDAATAGADTGAPAIFATQSPVDGTPKQFNLTISAASASTYTVTATPIAGSLLAGQGTLTLSSAGVRGGNAPLGNMWGSCRGI
ncbi:prepilin-type N-terminal cleavage/methylation domain-containing protein [Pseudomonas sp. CrR25]|nr:prepilin-type N-terminal cleavage/methylation domain-containing protein [Pseudomonas sp. CrR25]